MIFKKMVSGYFSHRRKKIDRWLKSPMEAQYEMLRTWMPILAGTEYGRQYQASSSDDYVRFAQKIPCVFYEDIEPQIEACRQNRPEVLWHRDIRWFAKSSGTTNAKSKFIPLSHQTIRENHLRAGKDLLAFYHEHHPDSKMLWGKTLRLGGSHEMYREGKSKYGDLSAILIEHLPYWIERMSLPSKEISLMPEWESKMGRIVHAVMDRDIRVLAGVPSWMLILLREILKEKNQQDFSLIWPHAEVYLHGGIQFRPYQGSYERIFPHSNFRYVEIYNASEGFFAFQDQPDSKDLLLLLDHGVFYEFIPMKYWEDASALRQAIPLENVKVHENYALVITTCSGLYRYIIGDTVRFTSLAPHRIRITGRTKLYINAFGEEVIIETTDTAVAQACRVTDAVVEEYTVAPRYISEGAGDHKAGCHEWVIAFDRKPRDLEKFKLVLDQTIRNLNSDYDAKRYKNMTLSAPVIHVAPPRLFYRWLKQKGKLGGQNKIPKLNNNREFLNELLDLIKKPEDV